MKVPGGVCAGNRARDTLSGSSGVLAAVAEPPHELHAEMAVIDENLCRAELSPAERASQTARRKAIYEELHPEAKAGAVSANARWNADANYAPAFTSNTAESTGRSLRAVQLDAERGEKISERALRLVVNTALNTGRFLDTLKKIKGEDAQVDAVQPALSGIAKLASMRVIRLLSHET